MTKILTNIKASEFMISQNMQEQQISRCQQYSSMG